MRTTHDEPAANARAIDITLLRRKGGLAVKVMNANWIVGGESEDGRFELNTAARAP